MQYEHHVAAYVAHKAGGVLTGYIVDAWGNYYQAKTPYGPYTFRLA